MSTNPLSHDLFERALKVFPSGVTHDNRYFGNLSLCTSTEPWARTSGTWTARNTSTTGWATARSCWGTVIPL